MDIQHLETPRISTCLRVQGEEEGMPILFLHGSFATSRWWEPLLAILPDEFRALAPDLRGAGCGPRTQAGYTIAEQAEDLDSIVTALGIRDFDLVAHGSGAAIAIEYLLSTGADVRSLTLVNPAPVEGAFTPLEAVMLLDQMSSDRALLDQAMAGLLPSVAASDPALFRLLSEDAAEMAPAAFTATAEALNHWNRFADAKKLTLPCLLIWGDEDPIVGRDAMTRTLVAIPGASNLEVLRGVGHAPMLDAPLLLAEKIVNFVTEDFAESASIRRRALE